MAHGKDRELLLVKENRMKRKISMLGAICLALMLVAIPFMSCGEPEAPPTPAAPTVITPTPAVVIPSPGLPPTPTVPVTPTTPAGPAKPVTPAPAPVVVAAPAGEPVFTVLAPCSYRAPVEVQGLSPRLDTLEGKTVGVLNLHGGNEEAIESVGPDLQAAVPGCNVIYFRTEGGFAAGPLTDNDWAKVRDCDACIVGHDF